MRQDILFKGTALITGASAGIGMTYAHQLAARGCDLILTARRADRLAALKAEIEKTYGVQVQTVSADLAAEAGIQLVEAAIEASENLCLLVNNAGFGIGRPFAESKREDQQAMVDVHISAAVRLMHAAVPVFMARGGGGIINVSSVAAFMTAGGSPSYSASKAYLNSFSRNLAWQLKGKDIRVQALCPGFTRTEFHAMVIEGTGERPSTPAWLWLDAEYVVKTSLSALPKKRVIVIPGWQYKTLAFISRLNLSGIIAASRRQVTGEERR